MTAQTPRILDGPAPTVAMNSLDEFTRPRQRARRPSGSRRCIARARADVVHGAGGEMFEAVKILRRGEPAAVRAAARRRVSALAVRPAAAADRAAHQGRRRARGRVRRRRRLGHAREPGRRARASSRTRLDDFARSIAALVADLGDRMDDVVILTMSEFGRTARQNGNGGTDHGHAGAMFVIGGRREGRQGARQVARPRAGAAVRGARPRAHDGLPRACSPRWRRSTSAPTKLDTIFPGYQGASLEWLSMLKA